MKIMKRCILSAGKRALERCMRAVRALGSRWRNKDCRKGQFPGRSLMAPLDADGWFDLYNQPVQAVRTVASPVAKALIARTKAGETLLEAGCGSAAISAELAIAQRQVELLDFSPRVLERALKVFEVSQLPCPALHCCDLTKKLPLADNFVDTVWNCGVLEHWEDHELVPIVREMARVSRRTVITLVPYAGSVFYRWAKAELELSNRWPYGRELPRISLRNVFESAGLRVVEEMTLCPESSIEFLRNVDAGLHERFAKWWSTLPPDDPLQCTMGYLLLTVGLKNDDDNKPRGAG